MEIITKLELTRFDNSYCKPNAVQWYTVAINEQATSMEVYFVVKDNLYTGKYFYNDNKWIVSTTDDSNKMIFNDIDVTHWFYKESDFNRYSTINIKRKASSNLLDPSTIH